MKVQSILAAVLLLLAANSYSENFYAELSVGKAQQKTSLQSLGGIKGRDISMGLQFGYKFMPYLAVEAGYNDYGKVSKQESFADTDISNKAFNIGLKTIAPLGKGFDFYLRGGLAWWDYQVDLLGPTLNTRYSNKDKDFYYGAGVTAKLKDFFYVGFEYVVLKQDFRQGGEKVNNKMSNMALTFGWYF